MSGVSAGRDLGIAEAISVLRASGCSGSTDSCGSRSTSSDSLWVTTGKDASSTKTSGTSRLWVIGRSLGSFGSWRDFEVLGVAVGWYICGGKGLPDEGFKGIEGRF